MISLSSSPYYSHICAYTSIYTPAQPARSGNVKLKKMKIVLTLMLTVLFTCIVFSLFNDNLFAEKFKYFFGICRHDFFQN